MMKSETFITFILLMIHVVCGHDDLFSLNLLSAAKFPRSKCLDGSQGGYYISERDPNVWIFHFQGGGWCTEDAEIAFEQSCVERSQGINPFGEPQSLGGTEKWPEKGCVGADNTAVVCNGDGGNHGIFSSDPAVNPRFANATKVYVGYCSGDSFAGSLDEPFLTTSGHKLYFRGYDIRTAVIADLLDRKGLAKASTVLLGGSSAGGIAVFLAADQIAAQIKAVNPSTSVLAIPDAGFFLDVPSFTSEEGREGEYLARPMFQWLFNNMNLAAGIPRACLEAYPGPEGYRCMYGGYLTRAAGAVATPTFVSNSMVDSAQAGPWLMNLSCDPNAGVSRSNTATVVGAGAGAAAGGGSCGQAEVDYLNKFRESYVSEAAPFLSQGLNGGWLVECFVHLLQLMDGGAARVRANGQTYLETLGAWVDLVTGTDHSPTSPSLQASTSTSLSSTDGQAQKSPKEGKMETTVVDTYTWSLTTGGNPSCAAY